MERQDWILQLIDIGTKTGEGAPRVLDVVSNMLGHADSSVTMDVYSAVLPEHHREAVDRLATPLDG